jgi:hypothetical protein
MYNKTIENPITNLIKYFQKEPGHALTFGYILLIAIGLFFDFSYYNVLKINVIHFVELDDLLLAPIQDVWILLTVFLFFLFVYGIMEWDIWWRKTNPESYTKYNSMFGTRDPFSEKEMRRRPTTFLVLFVAYIFLGANSYGIYKAKQVQKGRVDKVHLTMKDAPTDSISINKPVFFIGKTKSFFFVYDTASKKTTIINLGEIQRMEFEK